MRSSPVTVTISLAGIILAALGFYFGAVLPYLKGQSFILAQERVAYVHTVEEFKDNFDQSFNLYSPVGDEEITKFLGGNVLGIVNDGQPEDVSRELVTYMEGHLYKDEVRHLLLLGQMYQVLWQKFGQDGDYQKAVGYFEMAHEIGPNLPPPLYSLFGLYGMHGDKENYQRIGNLILANWPEDKETRLLLEKADG
jgi:hypothetical protein